MTGEGQTTTLHDGTVLNTHGRSMCIMQDRCCIHSPSEHPLRDAPMHWIERMKMMFRVCVHENIHPDPDALVYSTLMAILGRAEAYDGYHICCPERCCEKKESDDDVAESLGDTEEKPLLFELSHRDGEHGVGNLDGGSSLASL